jgi:hypothetical protein
MSKAPKQIVAERFGSREALVNQLLDMMGDDKDDGTPSSLRGARNAQLLRLHEVLTEVKDRFGTRDALVTAIAEKKFEGRRPDGDYVKKLGGYTQKRLLDLHKQVS